MPRARRPLLLLATTLAAALLAPLTAGAQETSRVEHDWYGWQNLLGLGGAYTLTAIGLKVDSGSAPLLVAGLSTYAFSGPIIHLAHGNGVEAGASLGFNLGLPLGAGLIGALLVCAPENCGGKGSLGLFAGAGFGILAGMLAANVIDVAFLSVEKIERPSPAATTSLTPEATRYRPLFQTGWQF
ncbi:hypothetical protein [Chondromyces crocatus]|uniref:Uncharacterized protein n=1 Tax=Chondromyces crocatus TaxID=52 RepID=A0A0K1EM85_CHOCO|nr:hypothetical protein [Chondromyces crocatus]AKT41926.1 uncharacterized protein CMC5_061480 [Chondromyces crocatus]